MADADRIGAAHSRHVIERPCLQHRSRLPTTVGGCADGDAAVWGDVVIARRHVGSYYHIAVVTDDAIQGVSHVVRGMDMEPATPIHLLLQRLLGLPSPHYHHHRLILDGDGRKLSKSHRSVALAALREEGETPAGIRAKLGLAAP